jgi:hypothetical protein
MLRRQEVDEPRGSTSAQANMKIISRVKLGQPRTRSRRIEFIERLVNVERRWRARLRDGTHVSVAKSHVQEVLRMIEGESSRRRVGSPKDREPASHTGGVNENIRKLPA